MYRPLASLPITKEAITKLRDYGFQYCEDVYDATGEYSSSESKELMQHLGCDLEAQIKNLMISPPTCSALDIWQEESTSRRIVTFCKELDDILHGGIPMQMITELCGAPGSGKTQLCLQLCVDVQIPSSLGGIGGEAIFVTTDSGFTFDRLNDMAEACVRHCHNVAYTQGGPAAQKEISALTVETFLRGVYYVNTHGYHQLIAATLLIQEKLEQNSQIKLIVIDSLAFPFRDGELSTLKRTTLLHHLLDDLQRLATKHRLAVVVTNQLTTHVVTGKDSQLVPALGESVFHRVSLRLMLGSLGEGDFAAVLTKSSSLPRTSASFRVVRDGVRDRNINF